jgi:putative endonuclease
MTTKDIGAIGENAAVKILKKSRYKILARNIHISHNELDIVALHKKSGMIVFVEVKTRSVNSDLYSPFGTPSAAVTKQKQLRTIQAARGYLSANPRLNKYQPRFDVIEVYLEKENKKIINTNHFENAFGL